MTQRIPDLPYFDEDGDIDDYDEKESPEELDKLDEYDGDGEEFDYDEEEL